MIEFWTLMRDAAYARHRILVALFFPPGQAQDEENERHVQFVDLMYSGVLRK